MNWKFRFISQKNTTKFQVRTFFLAHGDGLGPGDKGYKRMKKLFTNPVAQWFFKWLHPDIAMRIALYLSQKNKMIKGEEDKEFLGEDKEFLIIYAKEKLKLKRSIISFLDTATYQWFWT